MIFEDRRDAGRKLAQRVAAVKAVDPLVLAVPRGGIVVAAEVAQALRAPLDVLIARKIGSPHNEELAIGAVAVDGTLLIDESLTKALRVPDSYVKQQVEKERREIERRTRYYRGNHPAPVLKGRTLIVVDDGVATGMTIKAALRYLKPQGAERVVLALPVAPADTAQELRREVDELIVLHTPEPFYAVGQWYSLFDQTSDDEVVEILDSIRDLYPGDNKTPA
ncbi:MAG: phosphoribosyltransferase family protein [Bacillota bacterium]|nr:phosphoribosyltransferase family protein [Bacillota bacterium]